MDKKQRVRLVDIAKIAGVNKSTVSLALRVDPRIKPETRDRILAVANRLGYRPDPHLSHLMGYLRSIESRNHEECVAYLKLEPSEIRDLDRIPFFREVHSGARSEMEKLGYRVEVFRLRDYEFNTKRLSDVISHRGIRGLLVSPPVGITELTGFDWSRFAAVTIGFRLRSPQLCRVVCDQYMTIRTAMDSLAKRGYTRPLLAHLKGRDAHVNRRWSVAFRGSARLFPSFKKTEVFSGNPDRAFVDFVKESQADCVLGLGYGFAEALERSGFGIPNDIGFALLDKHDGPAGISCVDQQPFLLGQMSARQLSGFLDRNELGLPSNPFTLTISPSWCEGGTLKPYVDCENRRPSVGEKAHH